MKHASVKNTHNKTSGLVNICAWIVTALVGVTMLIGGGYFEYVSSFCLVLLAVVVILVSFQHRLKIPWSLDFLAFVCLAGAYLLSALWAVDSGIAVGGFYKTLPAVLFFLLLYQFDSFRERLLHYIPVAGVLLTVFTYEMSFFRSFRSYVCVNNRLSGTFQYPNTFAIFLLICIILLAKEKFRDKIDIVYTVILLFGIYKTGSFTTYILAAIVCGILILNNKKIRKIAIPIYLCLLVGVMIYMLLGHEIVDMKLKLSTFTGRLLYAQDALPLIAKHPFGLGYYGYFFMEKSIQTGVYTVVNIHNELLQFLLDIGWLPALFFFFVLIRAVVKKRDGYAVEYKIALATLLVHSMFDFDFQFLSILFLVVLLLPERETKEIVFGNVLCGIEIVCAIILAICAGTYGASNLLYTQGHYDAAITTNSSNTLAKAKKLSESTDLTEAEALAKDIEKSNTCIPTVYAVLAQCEYNRGNMEGYITQKTHALQLDPYNYDGYLEYMNVLLSSCSNYMQAGETDSAKICLKRMESVYDMLDKLAERTSTLGYQIQEKPTLTLPTEYRKLMNQLEMNLDE